MPFSTLRLLLIWLINRERLKITEAVKPAIMIIAATKKIKFWCVNRRRLMAFGPRYFFVRLFFLNKFLKLAIVIIILRRGGWRRAWRLFKLHKNLPFDDDGNCLNAEGDIVNRRTADVEAV